MKNYFYFVILSLTLVIGTLPVVVMASSSPMFRGMHQLKTSPETDSSLFMPEVIIVMPPQAFQSSLPKINKRYQKIVHHIAQSSLSQPVRRLLMAQADDSRCLALKQAQERLNLRSKHLCQRFPFQDELMSNKKALKLLRKIDKMP